MSTKRIVIFAFALLLALPALANNKDELYKQAQAAAVAGRLQEATNLYCQLAKEDAKYKDAGLNCKIMTDQVKKEAALGDDRFSSGLADFNAGRYDDAEQKFKNVRAGSHLAEAREYVSTKIPQARAAAQQAKNNAAQDSAMAQKFNQAETAYNSNDFATAKGLLSQITGAKQGEAQQLLSKIQKYEAAMADGDRLAGANNLKQAASSYNEAAAIKDDGPGNPRARAQQMLASGSGGGRTGGTTTAATSTSGAGVGRGTVSAIKETRPQVDVVKTLAAADAARKKGNVSEAIGKYTAVLAADPNNAQARIASEALKAELRKEESANGGAAVPKAGAEADVMLTKAIGEYYSGRFDQAEVHIQDYLDVNGSKTGLSYFFLGVSRLTRFYLSGAQETDRKLLKEAGDAFKQAKKVPGFKPPENLVSPKILKVYQGA